MDKPDEVQTIETVIEERKAAEEKYDDALAEGDKTAVMATHVSRRNSKPIVKVILGNFAPRTIATLTCFISCKLKMENDSFVFRIPICYKP